MFIKRKIIGKHETNDYFIVQLKKTMVYRKIHKSTVSTDFEDHSTDFVGRNNKHSIKQTK